MSQADLFWITYESKILKLFLSHSKRDLHVEYKSWGWDILSMSQMSLFLMNTVRYKWWIHYEVVPKSSVMFRCDIIMLVLVSIVKSSIIMNNMGIGRTVVKTVPSYRLPTARQRVQSLDSEQFGNPHHISEVYFQCIRKCLIFLLAVVGTLLLRRRYGS